MNKFNISSLLFLIFLFVNFSIAQSWNSFTSSNSELPNNMVNSIAVSNDGTVWFATDSGLAAYKNNVWQVFTDESVLSVNKLNTVSFLPFDSKDIWVGSDSGLVVFNVDSTEIIGDPVYINRETNSILSDTVYSAEVDGFSNNWIGTNSGLSVITNSGVYNFSKTNGLESNVVNALKVLPDNWVHIATKGGGVSRLKYNGVDGITSASRIESSWSALPSDTVLTIYVTDDTLYWYGTTKGVATFFGENSKSNNWWVYNTFSSEIIDNYVRAIVRDNEGNMWFGTKKGLSKLIVNNSTWESFTEEDGLISNNIFDIKIDKENNIWIATDKGVTFIFKDPSAVENNIDNDYKINLTNYPNPFNPETNIAYTIPLASKVKLEVFNNLGQIVKILVDKKQNSGNYQVSFKSTNTPSGIYFCRLTTEWSSLTKKMVLLK
ncbi:MAG: T9SS type A sorting domain-containing protein [Melioribacteraceae bacterium]|nr:T9SS type A sorting domain-containing protein [Melioribacteraceae bacterium]